MRAHRVLISAGAVVAVLAAGLALPAAASSSSPIVGTWTHSSGGVIQIAASGSTSYVGTVTSPINFGSCTHPVGERIWTLQDTQYGNEFSGTHVMCDGSSGGALVRLDDVDNAASPTIRLDLYVNGYSSGELRRPGTLLVTPTPTPTATPTPTPSPSPTATTAPEPRITITAPRSVARLTNSMVTVPVAIRTSGNRQEPFNWQVDVYGPSSTVPFLRITGQTPSDPGRDSATLKFSPDSLGAGAYYACAWGMTDITEVRTPNAPKSSCAWLRVQQRSYMWQLAGSLDCAPDATGGPQGWMTGIVRYSGTAVPMWRACSIRNSGYRGMTIWEPRTGRWYDFRTWTRAEIDDLFYDLVGRECRAALSRKPAALRACLGGGASTGNPPPNGVGRNSYYTATRAIGAASFDADLVMPGIQPVPDFAAVPSGGQRTND